MQPLFGIYVLSHEREDYLPITVDSILNQSIKDYKLYISDNSYSKNIRDMIKQKYKNKFNLVNYGINQKLHNAKFKSKFNFISHESVLSGAEHVSFLVNFATEPYIMLIHDDDYIDEDYLKEIKEAILKYPNISAYALNARVVDKKNKIISKKFNSLTNAKYHFINHDLLAKHYLSFEKQIMAFPSYIYNLSNLKEAFKNYEDHGKHADACALISLAKVKDFLWINKILFNYRIHGNNDSLFEKILDRRIFLKFILDNTNLKRQDKLVKDFRTVYWFLFIVQNKLFLKKRFFKPLIFSSCNILKMLILRPRVFFKGLTSRYFYLTK